MNADIFEKFLLSVGFNLETPALRKFETVVAGAAENAVKLGPAVESAAAGIIIFTTHIAGGLNTLFRASPLTDIMGSAVQVIQYAALLFGVSNYSAETPNEIQTAFMGHIEELELLHRRDAYMPDAGDKMRYSTAVTGDGAGNSPVQSADYYSQPLFIKGARPVVTFAHQEKVAQALLTLPAALNRALNAVGLLSIMAPDKQIYGHLIEIKDGADYRQISPQSGKSIAPQSNNRRSAAQHNQAVPVTYTRGSQPTTAGAALPGLIPAALAKRNPFFRIYHALIRTIAITVSPNETERVFSVEGQGLFHPQTGAAQGQGGTAAGDAAGAIIAVRNAAAYLSRVVRQNVENLNAALVSAKSGIGHVQRYGLALMPQEPQVIPSGYSPTPVSGANRETNITIYGVSDPVLAAREVSAQVEQVSSRLANLYYSGQR